MPLESCHFAIPADCHQASRGEGLDVGDGAISPWLLLTEDSGDVLLPKDNVISAMLSIGGDLIWSLNYVYIEEVIEGLFTAFHILVGHFCFYLPKTKVINSVQVAINFEDIVISVEAGEDLS